MIIRNLQGRIDWFLSSLFSVMIFVTITAVIFPQWYRPAAPKYKPDVTVCDGNSCLPAGLVFCDYETAEKMPACDTDSDCEEKAEKFGRENNCAIDDYAAY